MKEVNFRGVIIGVVLFIWILILPVPTGMEMSAWYMLAIAVLMATWWITDAIDQCITALLPIVLFPMFGIIPLDKVTNAYASDTIYLFLGGFMLALAMQKANLQRRIALKIINYMGVKPEKLILGFMLVGYLISMWMSNTAAALMITPLAITILSEYVEPVAKSSMKASRFGKALLLAVAYSVSIGGVATLVGTPANIIFASVLQKMTGTEITFASWFVFATPISLVLLFAAWYVLTHLIFRFKNLDLEIKPDLVAAELQKLGKMSKREKRVLWVFGVVVFLWMFRGLIDLPAFKLFNDTTVALVGAISLFIIPSGNAEKSPLLDRSAIKEIPWNILLLFGGGIALASGFSVSGLGDVISGAMSIASGVDKSLLLCLLPATVIFLTEFMSNTAIATLMIPVVISIASAMHIPPEVLAAPATIAVSLAFMLPVSTPPNAIVYSYNRISAQDMVQVGFILSIISLIIVSVASIIMY